MPLSLQQLAELKKENFGLKLRIYHLEEALRKQSTPGNEDWQMVCGLHHQIWLVKLAVFLSSSRLLLPLLLPPPPLTSYFSFPSSSSHLFLLLLPLLLLPLVISLLLT